MREGLPCFSYPQDKEIQKRPYSFSALFVTEAGPVGKGGWEMRITSPDRKGLLEPDKPETCIKYGIHQPGTRDIHNAEPLLMDTPYEVFISVRTVKGPRYERNYSSYFCITRDEKGNKIIVAADTDDDKNKYNPWKCLKPDEKPKRSFWERLFGK
ncbi:MAG: hypothetical protein ABFD76_17295 [Smithella sp.]